MDEAGRACHRGAATRSSGADIAASQRPAAAKPSFRSQTRTPSNRQVMGFRDPYVIEAGGGGRKWRIVLGSGIAGAGGALLVYASSELTSGAVHALISATSLPGFKMCPCLPMSERQEQQVVVM